MYIYIYEIRLVFWPVCYLLYDKNYLNMILSSCIKYTYTYTQFQFVTAYITGISGYDGEARFSSNFINYIFYQIGCIFHGGPLPIGIVPDLQ